MFLFEYKRLSPDCDKKSQTVCHHFSQERPRLLFFLSLFQHFLFSLFFLLLPSKHLIYTKLIFGGKLFFLYVTRAHVAAGLCEFNRISLPLFCRYLSLTLPHLFFSHCPLPLPSLLYTNNNCKIWLKKCSDLAAFYLKKFPLSCWFKRPPLKRTPDLFHAGQKEVDLQSLIVQ